MESDQSWLNERPPKLGDLIDDHCPRCKRVMNHAIASFVDDKVVKVICQTCYTEHPYLEGKEKKKASKSAASAFDQVLAKVAPSASAPAASTSKKGKAPSGVRSIYRHKAESPKRKK